MNTKTKAINTWFEKTDDKKCIYRHMGTIHGPPWTRNNGYETLDYIRVQHRWKNTVLDVESDTSGFVPTDHYPVIAKSKIKLRAVKNNSI